MTKASAVPARRSKFGAIPTVVNGIRFASRKEARRYSELLLLEKAGEICELKLQPRFPLVVNGHHIAFYVGDFQYAEGRDVLTLVVEDVKGIKTPLYALKRKLLLACHDVDLRET